MELTNWLQVLIGIRSFAFSDILIPDLNMLSHMSFFDKWPEVVSSVPNALIHPYMYFSIGWWPIAI